MPMPFCPYGYVEGTKICKCQPGFIRDSAGKCIPIKIPPLLPIPKLPKIPIPPTPTIPKPGFPILNAARRPG